VPYNKKTNCRGRDAWQVITINKDNNMQFQIKNMVTLTGMKPETAKAIKHRLTIYNPAFDRAEKMGRWTGNISRTLKFYKETPAGIECPRGEAYQLRDICEHYGEQIHLVKNFLKLAPIDFTFNGTLRPYQQDNVTGVLKWGQGTLIAPTGSGKTCMGLNIIAQRNQPALIIVHTKELVNQWIGAIEKFLGIPADQVGIIGGGKFSLGDQITVGMVQTVQERAPEISPYIGHLVMDECHDAPIMQYVKTVEQFNCDSLLGLTDTPYRRDGLERVLQWYIGPIAGQVNEQDILDNVNLNPGRALLVPTGFTPVTDPSDHYDQALNEMTLDMNRNQFIAITILKYKCFGLTLILSEQEEQCESLGDILNKKYCLSSAVLTAKTPAKQKRQIIKDLKAGKYHYLVATNKCIEKGLDLSRFSTLALVSPMKDSGSLIQYVCLALRQGSLKKEAFIIDFVDDHGEFASSSRSRWENMNGRVSKLVLGCKKHSKAEGLLLHVIIKPHCPHQVLGLFHYPTQGLLWTRLLW
jgi:superfamily II DNA or RNA helicase